MHKVKMSEPWEVPHGERSHAAGRDLLTWGRRSPTYVNVITRVAFESLK